MLSTHKRYAPLSFIEERSGQFASGDERPNSFLTRRIRRRGSLLYMFISESRWYARGDDENI